MPNIIVVGVILIHIAFILYSIFIYIAQNQRRWSQGLNIDTIYRCPTSIFSCGTPYYYIIEEERVSRAKRTFSVIGVPHVPHEKTIQFIFIIFQI